MIKREILDKKVWEGLIIAFEETVNLDNDSVSPNKSWNQVKWVCQQCLYDSSEGLVIQKHQSLQILEISAQPTNEEILKHIQECHDSPVGGYRGLANTYDLLGRSHPWNQMRKDMDGYIQNCHTCLRSMTIHRKTHGLLRLLEVPERPWKDLSMDLMVGLPATEVFNVIWVVVSHITKIQHLVTCTDIVDRKKLGIIYVKEVFRLHGLPETMVSDRGLQCALKFWKQVWE
jgi:hypothetical protein